MKPLKLLKRLITATIILSLAVICAVYLAVYHETSRNRIVTKAVYYAAQKSGYQLQITGLKSEGIGSWQAENLDVYKDKQLLLKAEKLSFDWQFDALLNDKIQIDKLEFDKLTINQSTAIKKEGTTGYPKVLPVTIDAFAINTLVVNQTAIGLNNEYSVKGKLAILDDKLPLFVDLSIKTLNGLALSANIKTTIDENGKAFITGNVSEEAGGMLGSLMRQKKSETLNIAFDSEIQGNTNNYDININNFSLSYQNHKILADGVFSVDKETKSTDVKQLNIKIDDKQQKISGIIGQDKIDIQAVLDKIPADIMNPWINKSEATGELSANVNISDSMAEPYLSGSVAFDGSYYNIPLKLTVSANGNINKFTISDFKIQTQLQGTLALQGGYDHHNLDFKVKAEALPSQIISAIGWDMKAGKLEADLAVKGTDKAPLFNGTMQFTSHITDNKQSIPVTMSAKIETTNDILKAEIAIKKSDEKLGNASVNLPISNYRNLEEVNGNTKLKGSITTDFDLAYLRLLLDQDIHSIKGRLKADIMLDGSIGDPVIKGDVELVEGGYENSLSGTSLHNINAKLKAENTKITIMQATASDGEKGKMILSGKIDWSDKAKTPVNLELKAEKAKLLRRHDMDGSASGNLALTGSFSKLSLIGVLDVTPFTMTVDTLLSKEIPELKITEEYSDETPQETPLVELIPVMHMDVTIKADNQAYLRGSGLDAELKGNINIQGTLNKSLYSGSFKTVRGSYEILGKKFILKDGSVRFEGNTISLLIPGVYKGNDIEIRAELSGTLDELNLNLSSNPSMPQDEILSNLLFGKSARSISPLQAIRLANTIRKLKGGSKELFDPVGMARKLIGVDTISVDSEQTANGQDVTVGVGKYINEKVYIEVEKGSNPAQTFKGSVEAEILPNLNVESSTGGDSGLGGVELQWKHDY